MQAASSHTSRLSGSANDAPTRAHYWIFLERLRLAREAKGLSRSDAARLLKRSQPYLTRKEDGARMISVVELMQFARIYGTTPKVGLWAYTPQ